MIGERQEGTRGCRDHVVLAQSHDGGDGKSIEEGEGAMNREADALLIVDEAHGIGVAGQGRGMVHAAGLAGVPHVVVTATLSKALGTQGGAVLGSSLLREHLVHTARTFIFDTGLVPAAAALLPGRKLR